MFNFHSAAKQNVSYGILGTDRFGYTLVEELAESGVDLLVAGKKSADIRELRNVTENAQIIRDYSKAALKDAGFKNCDVVIVCLEDMTDSILATLNLGNMGVKKIISRASSTEHGEILEKLGAEVIYPERDMAVRLASRFKSNLVLDFVQLNEVLSIFKAQIPDVLAGKTVLETSLRRSFDLNIIAVVQNGKLIERIRPDMTFQQGDVLFLSGRKEDFSRFIRWADSQKK